MVCGLWRPTIVLPTPLASGWSEDLQLSLGHEVAHIKRRDLIWATVAWLVRATFFFNPIVWLAEKELRSAQESATDQEAVWLTGASVTAYGKMLLRAICPERVADQPSGLGMFDSFRNAQRRLRAIKYFSDRPHSFRRFVEVMVVAVGVGCLPTYLLVPAAASPQFHPKATPPKLEADHLVDQLDQDPIPPETHPAKPKKQPATSNPKPNSAAPQLLASRTVTEPQTKTIPDLQFVDEGSAPAVADPPESAQVREESKKALDEFNNRVNTLIQNQDERIADYRIGADERERGAEQRESEAQQRKREGVQRARAALLREQVIEMREKNDYEFAEPGQKDRDAQTRRDDKRQTDADQYQLVLDQRQRETDAWQRNFDANSIAAMRHETQQQIATARKRYEDRIAELHAGDKSRRQEAADALAFFQSRAQKGADPDSTT
jgi:hypothetical protein